MPLTDQEKAELRALVDSDALREDMEHMRANRHNPFIVDDEVDCDRVIEFLTGANEFLNHPRKPFRPFIERNMKL